MKTLIMLIISWTTCSWAGPNCFGNRKCHACYKDDGNGGVIWTYKGADGMKDTQHLSAEQWAVLQRHWKTGEPLPGCQAAITKQAQEGQERTDELARQYREKQLAQEKAREDWRARAHAMEKAQAQQEAQNQENAFLSDAMYSSLWSELYEYESGEYYRYGDRGSKRKWRDAYGDSWLKLSRASRSDWYNYLFPKIDFGQISGWSQQAHVKAEEERQQYMRDWDAAGRGGDSGSGNNSGGEN